jgi:hypothetical protein
MNLAESGTWYVELAHLCFCKAPDIVGYRGTWYVELATNVLV